MGRGLLGETEMAWQEGGEIAARKEVTFRCCCCGGCPKWGARGGEKRHAWQGRSGGGAVKFG